MFRSPESRYLLRSALFGIGALLSALVLGFDDNSLSAKEIVVCVSSGFSAFVAYLGIGAAVPVVEPFVGNKKEDANVV